MTANEVWIILVAAALGAEFVAWRYWIVVDRTRPAGTLGEALDNPALKRKWLNYYDKKLSYYWRCSLAHACTLGLLLSRFIAEMAEPFYSSEIFMLLGASSVFFCALMGFESYLLFLLRSLKAQLMELTPEK